MHRVPMGRKFGGPEIALIAVALAFAVPMTAWWYGLYQDQGRAQTGAPTIIPSIQVPAIGNGAKIHGFTVMGYFVNVDATNSSLTFPAFVTGANGMPSIAAPSADPNQALLLAVALLGIVAAGVYTMAVYPALRR